MSFARRVGLFSLVLLSAGCELIASVDSSKIPTDDGGGGAGGTAPTGCTDASTCPASTDACLVAACNEGTCGFEPAPAGTPAANVARNCSAEQCDGTGQVTLVADDTDLPDDGLECTQDTCVAGEPTFTNLPGGAPCGRGGLLTCDGNGTCVGCMDASDCGDDTECQTFACDAGACSIDNTPSGTPLQKQDDGDCQLLQCDGDGNEESIEDNDDLPDDNNVCTQDVCTSGVPSNPNEMAGTTCGTDLICDGSGQCVGCTAASQCPGSDTDCQTRTCDMGACDFAYQPMGTVTSIQVTGDCQQNQCDGMGVIVSVDLDTDVPAPDMNDCTIAACNGGMPAQAPVMDGAGCNDGSACTQTDTCQSGVCQGANPVVCTPSDQCHDAGTCDPMTGVCSDPPAPDDTSCDDGDGCTQTDTCQSGVCEGDDPVVCMPSDECHIAGACQSGTGVCTDPSAPDGTPCTGGECNAGTCVPFPSVVSTTPASGASGIGPTSTISITFSEAMNPATLTVKSTLDAGACSGSIQLSTDNFATCIPLGSLALSAGDTVLTATPTQSLAYGSAFQIRVTTAAESGAGLPLAANFTQAAAFTTSTGASPIDGSLVISQVYGGGGNTGAPFTHDFVEIHNRGTTTVSVAGFSVQYASAAGSTWTITNLTGSIPAGGYYLVQQGGGANGSPLPTPDAMAGTAMSATAGKVALVSDGTMLTGACPVGGSIIDFVGYGSTASCFEGAGPTPAPSATASVTRGNLGFIDTGVNSADFATGAPTPRNTASPSRQFVLNETGNASEADYCAVAFPFSIDVQTATTSPDVFCQVFEAGQTEAAGPAGTFTVDIGYGPATSNPQSQAGWTWVAAPFNVQVGNNDEYHATFTAPAAGDYRYACRVNFGGAYTYCDLTGAGSNTGLTFETPRQPVMTVTP